MKVRTEAATVQFFPSLTAATSCRQLSQLSHAVASFDICCKLSPVKAVASFASTWRLIHKSADQLYAIPIDCIASFLLSDFLQDCDTVAKYQWWPPPWIITLAPDLDKFRIAIKIRYCINETISMFNSANTVKWDNSGDKAELMAVYELILWVR